MALHLVRSYLYGSSAKSYGDGLYSHGNYLFLVLLSGYAFVECYACFLEGHGGYVLWHVFSSSVYAHYIDDGVGQDADATYSLSSCSLICVYNLSVLFLHAIIPNLSYLVAVSSNWAMSII